MLYNIHELKYISPFYKRIYGIDIKILTATVWSKVARSKLILFLVIDLPWQRNFIYFKDTFIYIKCRYFLKKTMLLDFVKEFFSVSGIVKRELCVYFNLLHCLDLRYSIRQADKPYYNVSKEL